MGESTETLVLTNIIVLFVLVVAGIVLTFAISGTKRILRELISEVRKTNVLLQQSIAHQSDGPDVAGRSLVSAPQARGSEAAAHQRDDMAGDLIDKMERPFVPFAFTAPAISIGIAIIVLFAAIIVYGVWRT